MMVIHVSGEQRHAEHRLSHRRRPMASTSSKPGRRSYRSSFHTGDIGMKRGSMILSAFFFNPQGDHRMSWRHPSAPGREIFGLDYYRRLAGAAEAAKLDAIFVADHVAIWDSFESNVAHYANARLEPL